MNTNTATLAPATDNDGFTAAVRDILAERWPHHGNAQDIADDIADVTQLIADAYAPRMGAARIIADRSRAELRTYAERDRALHALLLQAKRTAQLFLDGKERATAGAEGAQAALDRVRLAVERARQDGAEMVAVAEVLPLLAPPLRPESPRLPVVVAVQPDARWSHGAFRTTAADDLTPRSHYPLIGWAIVLHSAYRTMTEPVFLVEGNAVTQSGLLRNGLILDHIR